MYPLEIRHFFVDSHEDTVDKDRQHHQQIKVRLKR